MRDLLYSGGHDTILKYDKSKNLLDKMHYDDRLLFYLGSDKNKQHKRMNQFTIDDLTVNINTHDQVYDVPLKKLLIETENEDKRFHFTRGDVITLSEQNNWTLSKNRCEGNTSSVLLRCFNTNRHWGRYYKRPKDIPFEQKKSVIFWRGVSTGCSQHFSAKEWSPRPVNRFKMLECWFNKLPDIDVGFSQIHRDWLRPSYEKYLKGICSPEKFLNHKYLLSIEGNDKDSGLNWKLNSNSVVFMPEPRVTTWLMEEKLEAGKHYILVKDDFSDLHDKLTFCNQNPDYCIEVVKNANAFMKQFNDLATEKKLEVDVLNTYFKLKAELNKDY